MKPLNEQLFYDLTALPESVADDVRKKVSVAMEHIVTLYFNYKRTTDDDIRERLTRIAIVKPATLAGLPCYVRMHTDHFQKIYQRPRDVTLTFDATEYGTDLKYFHQDLDVLATIDFLVKCNSRYFLKPDIGEVFDQVKFEYWPSIKAVHIPLDNYYALPGSQGEHFIMQCELLKQKKTEI